MATNDSYATSPPEATAIGRVEAVNHKGTGIKFEGTDTWHNISKYAVGIVLPTPGETVSVTFDRQGFIRSIGPADGMPAAISRAAPAANVNDSTKDRTITRLAVLKAAAQFSASKPEALSSDVLKIAAAWERWVLREDESPDLVDAF
jgi:hypothetical protein